MSLAFRQWYNYYHWYTVYISVPGIATASELLSEEHWLSLCIMQMACAEVVIGDKVSFASVLFLYTKCALLFSQLLPAHSEEEGSCQVQRRLASWSQHDIFMTK